MVNSSSQYNHNKASNLAWTIFVVYCVLGLAGYYYVAEHYNVFVLFYTTLSLLAAAALFRRTQMGFEASRFVVEAFQEVHKVTWPTKDEAGMNTLFVLVGIGLASLLIKIIDVVVSQLLSWFLK